MGSSRFPGKMMQDIDGKPTIARVVERLERCRNLDSIILATTKSAADDVLVCWAENHGLPVHRGSEDDVLGRVVGAHRKMNSEIIVEICGDCPLIDPQVVDLAVETFLANDCDLVTTVLKRSFPKGMDVEVFRFNKLTTMDQTIKDPEVREHVSLSFYQNPDRYRLLGLTAPQQWTAPNVRCVLDYPEDLKFIQAVFRNLGSDGRSAFGIDDVLALVRRDPGLLAINAMHEAT